MALQWTDSQFCTVLKVTCPFLILCTDILSKTHLWVSRQSESIDGLSVFMIYFFHLCVCWGAMRLVYRLPGKITYPLFFSFTFSLHLSVFLSMCWRVWISCIIHEVLLLCIHFMLPIAIQILFYSIWDISFHLSSFISVDCGCAGVTHNHYKIIWHIAPSELYSVQICTEILHFHFTQSILHFWHEN